MDTVTQAARAFCQARKAYTTAFRTYFQNQVQLLDMDRFWQLQQVFVCEVHGFRFGYQRTNGVEQAAGELFRKPYAGYLTTYGGPDVPAYTIDEAVQFAKTWAHIADQLYQPLFDVVTDRGDDGYGDLLDSIPLAGREVVERALAAGFSHNDVFERAVTRACREQKRPEFSEFILHGENYIGMQLADAAETYFALQADHDSSEVQHGQT